MLRFGIIGGGMIADFHAQAIEAMDGGILGAICVRDPGKARTLESRYGCKVYTRIEDLCQDSDIEIVTVATPSGAHLEPAMLAASHGKHIICEKPLEVTPKRAKQMIDHCEKSEVTLSGIFNRRFNPAVVALDHAIRENRFGQLTLCDAQVKWYRNQAYYDSAAWRGTWKLDGGGALMNQSIHTIDLLLYFAGAVARVSATTACLGHKNIEVEDTAVAILEFKNGARGSIQGSTACWSSHGHPAEVQICGTKGSAFLADDRFRAWDFSEERTGDSEIRDNLMMHKRSGVGANDPRKIDYLGHKLNFEDVVNSIEAGKEPTISGGEAIKAIILIDAIYKSARSDGQWVIIPE